MHRAIPIFLAAGVAFGVGALSSAGSPEEDASNRFLDAWADQDFEAMYDELSPASQQEYSLEEFTTAYEDSQSAATATAIDPGEASGPDDDAITMEVGVRTEVFDLVEGDLVIPFTDEKIDWAPHLTFPGLEEGEAVGRRLTLGDRSAILAQGGTPLAEGQGGNRSSPLGSAAIDVTGEVGTPDDELRPEVVASGYPGDQDTGISGLELAFNAELAGQARRRAARGQRRRARPARTSAGARRAACSRPPSRRRAATSRRPSTRTFRRRRSRPSAAGPAAPSCWTPATARSARSPARPSRSSGRPDRPSR